MPRRGSRVRISSRAFYFSTMHYRIIGLSPSGKAQDFDSCMRWFESSYPSQKKASRKTCFFLSNPKDWYGITRRVYGIRRKATAWHTPCSLAVSTAARCALFRQRRNARGAICARSLTSKLADLLRLIITRRRVFLLRIDAIHHFVSIPFARSSRFHAATSCGFHTRLRRDWDAEDAHQTHEQIQAATP